jgi:hypothetical protein
MWWWVFGLIGRGTMKHLTKLAVLALPVVAAISLGAPAAATPSADSPSRADSSGTAAVISYISNQTTIGIGVMHVRDGRYDMGAYDAILPSGQRTDTYFGWVSGEGVYVGSGGCVKLRYWTGSGWAPGGTYYGPAQIWPDQHLEDPIARWEVRHC